MSCVEPDTVKCYSSNPCASTPGVNGFVADPFSCNGYYYCEDGDGIQGLCSSGWNFNPETKNCIRNFPCELKILPYDYCNIVPDGVFIKVPNTCTDYQTCWRGDLLNGTCPHTFYFNAINGECDYPENVDCVESTTLAPEIPSEIECPEAGVFIADGKSCNGYYYCKGLEDGSIEPIHSQCPDGRFFDPKDGGACVIRTNIACPYNRCVTMGYENIQLANVYDDGCTGFHLCQDGEIIGSGECPSGQYFNELLQLCTEQMVTFAACSYESMESTESDNETEDNTTDTDSQTTDNPITDSQTTDRQTIDSQTTNSQTTDM